MRGDLVANAEAGKHRVLTILTVHGLVRMIVYLNIYSVSLIHRNFWKEK